MSVNSKMTAIADKIRALLGTSGTMGLDAMSTNLTTIQTDISGAFAAVGNKGGTIPTAKTSGNLASAINSITTGGTTVQKKTGTFQGIGSHGEIANVNCGFSPDVVFIHLPDAFTEGGNPYVNDMAAYTGTADIGEMVMCSSFIGELYQEYQIAFGYIIRTENGFIATSFGEQALNGEYWYTTKTYGYTAIKYS